MRSLALVLGGILVLACGSDDGDGSGSGGTGGSGAASGGAAGAGGGSPSGGGAGAGGAAGGGSLCKATTNPFPNVDCAAACQHFTAWTAGTACANPYAGSPDCVPACETIKASTPYTNVLFGCAAEQADCAAFKQCRSTHCG